MNWSVKSFEERLTRLTKEWIRLALRSRLFCYEDVFVLMFLTRLKQKVLRGSAPARCR